MSDSAEQSNGEAEASSTSALAERLIRRGTEPLGVIDVRHAEQKYFRIVRWLGRHSALLDHLRSRYGADESTANAERPFATGRRPMSRDVIFSTSIQSLSPAFDPRAVISDAPRQPLWELGRPSSLAQIIAERSAGTVSDQESSPDREFRISRRPPPPMSRPSGAAQPASPRDASVSEPKQLAGGAAVSADSSAHHGSEALVLRSGGVDRTVESADVNTGADAQEKRSLEEGLPSVPGTNEQTGTASSIVQRELIGSSSVREQQLITSVRNSGFAQRRQDPQRRQEEETGTASSIVQRELVRSSNPQEPSASAPVRYERADTDSSFVQRSSATNTIAQERPASARDLINTISPILQREAGTDTSAQGPPANLKPETGNQKPETLNAQPRILSRIAVRDEPNPFASSIVQRADRGIPNAPPLSPNLYGRSSVAAPPFAASLRSGEGPPQGTARTGLPLIRPLAEPPGETFLPVQSAGAEPLTEFGDAGLQQDAGDSETSKFVPGAIAAPEIRGDSLSRKTPHIVWREPQPGPRAADFTARESRSGSGLSRADQTGPADFLPATQQSAQDGPGAKTQNQSREIELEHISPRVIRSISEQVVRAITLDLKIERERRGSTKWR